MHSASLPATAMLMLLLSCVLATTHAFLLPSTPSFLSSSSSSSFSPGTFRSAPSRLYPGLQFGGLPLPSRRLSYPSLRSGCPSFLCDGWLSYSCVCEVVHLDPVVRGVLERERERKAPGLLEGQGVGVFLLPFPSPFSPGGACSSTNKVCNCLNVCGFICEGKGNRGRFFPFLSQHACGFVTPLLLPHRLTHLIHPSLITHQQQQQHARQQAP